MELVRAQFAAFAKQIPLLYFILATNTAAVSWTFARSPAPKWLSVWIPMVLCSFCVFRLVWWWRRRNAEVSDEQALTYLRTTNVLAALLAVGFTTWGLCIFGYGDPYAQGHVAFYMALTVIGCIFCLMHLRSAALWVTMIVNVPYIVFFLLEGHGNFKAMAVNIALVCAAMIVILGVYYRDFANLVESRKALMAKQAETQRLSDDNFRLANLDSLTDLPNRRWFFSELERTHTQAQQDGTRFAIGIIDLDGFKPVNDTYGHSTGDRVLIEVGHRLRKLCGEHVRLARLGGDEFAVIVTANPSDAVLTGLGKAIGDVIRVPYAVGSSHALLACSIGFAAFPDSAAEPEPLYERADYALYFAKRNLRGHTVLFSADHEDQIRNHSVIEQAFQSADLAAELSVAFQPITDARSGRTLAFEALARWDSPSLGTVAPDRFIPVAERIGLIGSMTRVLLEKTLNHVLRWPEHVRVSFNLSAHDLSASESVIQIIAAINRSGIDPKRLDFEITETSVAYDFAQARAAIVAFKALGVGISLDDFGTGYSSLSHVHRLPLDKIKVDRSFITDIGTNDISHKIVKSLTALCSDMGLTCVVEGVETEMQLRILAELGCDIIQGYYFAKPMAASEVEAYLAAEPSRRRKRA